MHFHLAVKHQLALTVGVNPKLAQEHCAQRICTRARGVPLHDVGITVQALNYALFNSVFKKFAVNADVTKSEISAARTGSEGAPWVQQHEQREEGRHHC